MYESMTFEYLLERMLNKVPDNLDKREGSIIYNAIAPVAAEFANMYIKLDFTRSMTSVLTSTGTYLDEKVRENGLERIPATKAIVKGEFNVNVSIGDRFNGNSLNYAVTEKVSDKVFLLECETAGTVGNASNGTLSPINYVQGFESAEIVSIEIPAIDTETDEELRARYFDSITGSAEDGNVAQYKKWILEYADVGRGRVFPLWNGKNTVKVSILNAENKVASETLVKEFQKYMDPNSEGLGNGVAPIGSIVTVSTATERVINISVDIYLKDGYTTADGVEQAVRDLFTDLAYTSSAVNFYAVAFAISSCESVAKIANLKVNSAMEDILLGSEEIPVVGTFSVQVVET